MPLRLFIVTSIFLILLWNSAYGQPYAHLSGKITNTHKDSLFLTCFQREKVFTTKTPLTNDSFHIELRIDEYATVEITDGSTGF